MPGVEVTVTQTDTVDAFCDNRHSRPVLPSRACRWPYKLAAKLSGFSPFEQTGIVLRVGEARSANVQLKIGGMSETVKVMADANLVETRGLSVGAVTTQETIVGLPLNGRSATQLLVLEGGAVEGGTTAGNRGYPGQVAISVAGGSGNSTQYLVDGGYNNDPSANSGNAILFPDALQEFRTESGVRDARFGMSTGATVNAVTKAGTNGFHGNMFDFLRDHEFNAIAYFDKKENGGLGKDDGLHRNQYGGTIGGPIIRDKLFFFEGIQATLTKQRPTSNQTVMTADMLRGDFRNALKAIGADGPVRLLTTARTWCAVRGQSNQSGVVQPAVAQGCEHGAAARSGVRSEWVRHLHILQNNDTDQQYVTGRLPGDGQQADLRPGLLAFNSDPPSFDKNQPNLLDASAGSGTRAFQHTVATGLDYVVSSTSSRRRTSRISTPTRNAPTATACRRWACSA